MDMLTGRGDGQVDQTIKGPEREMYGPEDFSDQVTAWFVRPWRTKRGIEEGIGDLDLVYLVDENIEDPIVLHCGSPLFMPEGARIMAYDGAATVPDEETTYTVIEGLLVHPDIVEYTGEEAFYDVPEAMQGLIIEPRDGRDNGYLNILASSLAAVRQDEDRDTDAE